MIFRPKRVCPLCGKPLKEIHQHRGKTFVGDTFAGYAEHNCPALSNGSMKTPGNKYLTIRYLSGNQSPERGLNRTNGTMKGFQVTMKLTCGPVTSHTDGVQKDHTGKEWINKNIVMHAQYSNNPEDNNFAMATPSAKLEFSLGNPGADIFAPGRKYKVTLEEWPEDEPKKEG